MGNDPNFSCTLKIPAIVPGMPIERAPYVLDFGMISFVSFKNIFFVAFIGAFSL